MRRKNHTLLHFLTTLLLVMLLHACDFFGSPYPPPELPPQTQILRIDILPNDTLAPGDTATFRCVIADSLDTRYKFYWGVWDNNGLDTILVTNKNFVWWKVPFEPGKYVPNVTVDNGSKDSIAVSRQFKVFVME